MVRIHPSIHAEGAKFYRVNKCYIGGSEYMLYAPKDNGEEVIRSKATTLYVSDNLGHNARHLTISSRTSLGPFGPRNGKHEAIYGFPALFFRGSLDFSFLLGCNLRTKLVLYNAIFRIISRHSRPINPQEDSAPHGITIFGQHWSHLIPPGMVIAHHSEEEELRISEPASVHGLGSFEFRVVKGLDGKKGTISLESQNRNGCFVFSGSEPGQALTLSWNSGVVLKKNSKFAKGASFVRSKGLRE